jgi:AcrR family transcriptional regulator
LARGGGPSAVLLRAVSRQAGVSHNAAYRHFADQEDLLAAVAQRCMTQLSLLMIERMERVEARSAARRARLRLESISRAYIDFALSEPGWFRTAFTSARPRPANSRTAEAVPNPYDVLGATLDDLVRAGGLTPRRRAAAQYTPITLRRMLCQPPRQAAHTSPPPERDLIAQHSGFRPTTGRRLYNNACAVNGERPLRKGFNASVRPTASAPQRTGRAAEQVRRERVPGPTRTSPLRR